MSNYFGDFAEDSTVYIPWSSNDGSGASITRATNGSIVIYKNNSVTQKATVNGVTDSEDFDAITGIHLVTIDTSNDAGDAGFWAAGNDYWVVLSGATIDGQTVNAVLGIFSLENRYMRGTDGANTTTPPTAVAIRSEIDSNSTQLAKLGTIANLGSGATIGANLADIEAQTDEIGIAGAGLTAVPWNPDWDTEVQSEVQDAIEANHLDHLLAVAYDPATKPGAADALLNELVEDDAGLSRFTANALEQAPAGGGGGSADWTAGEKEQIRQALGLTGIKTATSGGNLDTVQAAIAANLDAAVSTRLATAGYTAPDNASITAILADTAALDALLAELTEDDGGGNQRYTSKALENAPGGGGLTLADIADAVLDEVVEASAPANAQTLRQLVRLIVAAMFGKSSIDEDGQTVRFRDLADSKDRIVGKIDSSGYRTDIDTLDGS